jgi:glucans biosynthesis protein
MIVIVRSPYMTSPLLRCLTFVSMATASVLIAADSASIFESLRAEARKIASEAYVPPADHLDDFWKNLSYDAHRDIRFKMESGLWWSEKGLFSIDFFHPGWTARQTVDFHEIRKGVDVPLSFDLSLFDYGKQIIPPTTPAPPGYAGWRARTHLNSPDYMDEFLVFLGASYFRAIPAKGNYGLSARGLAINSGLPGVPEEFPNFTRFYLEEPKAEGDSLTALALLEGESVSGAYRFTVTPGEDTVMEVEAEITLRRQVAQLGIAPFSSMFWFGESTFPRPYDFRPEVHDSDGVLMELAGGELHYRPLETTQDQFRHCVFSLESPRSWSLVQRDRSFASYEDSEAAYHLRPSVKVEPLEGFDRGRLHLIELPTADETNDNVILAWEPQPVLEIGKPYRFHYRLHWTHELPPSGLFAVRSTRVGMPVQKPNEVLMVIEFAKPLLPEKKEGNPKWDDITAFQPVVTVSDPKVKLVHVGLTDMSMAKVDELPAGLGRSPEIHMPQVLRAFFVFEPESDVNQADFSCELQDGTGKAVSERWVYFWKRAALHTP